MKKLLTKTLSYYTIFASLMLLLTSPVFYFLSEKLYIDDVDEAIHLRKIEFVQNNLPALTVKEIPVWNKFNRDIHLLNDTVSEKKEVIIDRFFYDTLDVEWEPYRVLYSDIKIENRPYTMMIRLNLVESEDLMKTTALLYIITLIVLLVVIIIVSKIISDRLWKPFYETLLVINDFNIEQHLLPPFTSGNTKEFEQLNHALQKLIEQNIMAYQTQKEFTENASHELQTPLAVFQSKLDLLLQNPSLTEEQALIIQQLYEASSRLSKTNKNLLLLAKIENKVFTQKENISIDRLINEVLPYFGEQAEEKEISSTVRFENPLVVFAHKGLSEILINNLLLNAIRHNSEKGKILIHLKNNELIISNTGNGEALQNDKLFKRFSKISENAHSSGLGLAIVDQICKLNGWKVTYYFENNLHHFSISF
jgi:signal transduction histidine kinase